MTGNPIEKEHEEEIRFLLEGIDFEELGGNDIEGDGRKDCEGRVGGLSLRVMGERTVRGRDWIGMRLRVQNITEKGKRKLYERFLNESSSEFDDSSDENYVPSSEGSDSETPSLVLEDIECDSDDDIFLLKDPSSEGSETEKHPAYKKSTSMKNLKLVVGMKFENVAQFRVVLRDWCIRNGVDLEFLRNEAARVTAKCKSCEWRIHASPIQGGPTFQIKTIKCEHTCARTYDNKLANASYIAKRIENAISDHPTIPVQQLKNIILSKSNVDVSRFKALKKGFQEGCRPIISLDGYFLKTVYGGQLLVAVGRDGNDNMFPIAMAVVQVENRDTWGGLWVNCWMTLRGWALINGLSFLTDKKSNVAVHEEIPQGSQAPLPLSQEQPSAKAAARGRRQSSRTTQPPGPRSTTQQVGYEGPRNASLLGNVNPATSSVLATKRYNKRPSISEVLDKMKERQQRRQHD
ncbi:hypothetical protein Sango_0020700 [Sesamum angolense]|uniref:Transposase MuDR plant domain-containing protein n=1 Tax=Sesamum angolense TaxID=2727404 RepID=A0AAE1XCM1_9LAMI|nr:hypothetical protein Sango_0020700 [Sesamum angolense]